MDAQLVYILSFFMIRIPVKFIKIMISRFDRWKRPEKRIERSNDRGRERERDWNEKKIPIYDTQDERWDAQIPLEYKLFCGFAIISSL